MWSTNWILIYLFVPLLTLGFTTTYYPGQGFYVFAINGDESVPNDYGWQVTDNGTIVTVGLDSYFPTDGSNIMVAMVEVPKFLLTVENTFNENLLNVSVRLPVREGRTLIQYLPDAIKRQDTALLSQYVPVPDDEITFRFATYSGLQPPSPSAVPLPNNTPPTPQQATINYTIINNIMDPTFSNMITLAVDAGSPMINYMERALMYMVEFDGYFVYAVNGVVADWQTTYWILTNNTDQITAESLALTYTYVPDNANTTTEATPA
ncbi:hypothetical protein MAR_001989 [Mya arenaria]|uniref:Uncharacterized protein n=1 Tax=Mya arenaria TaxID=6604 RepID=A0ABY7FHC0_MYAAR|nr:hypothetical protein MAR_001989 [Mya arenaria]